MANNDEKHAVQAIPIKEYTSRYPFPCRETGTGSIIFHYYGDIGL